MEKQRKQSAAQENFMRQFRNKTNNDLTQITASQLLAIWDHYDVDGNGFIEEEELDRFLVEFVTSVCASEKVGSEVVSPSMLEELKQDFLDAYDENDDHRIEIKELALMLPLDENFLLLFQLENRLTSSVDFMKIWHEYDTDRSGFIEGSELRAFMKNLILAAHGNDHHSVGEEKLDEYCKAILRIFDSNNDGKLSLNELSRLFPLKDNALTQTVQKALMKNVQKVDLGEIEEIFNIYDSDKSGQLESDELSGFTRDLLALMKPKSASDETANMDNLSADEVNDFQAMMLKSCDTDGDGKIGKEELTIFLMGLQKFIS